MYVFYDTETTGLDTDFSQILQIALVFADSELNILSTLKLECRCSPWVVPSPGALLTTGFIPDEMKFNKLSHYEMMLEVDRWIRGQHWPLTFIGYNSMGYDEPLLAGNRRQSLLDPGITTAGNPLNGGRNGRADILTFVRACALYKPGVFRLTAKTGKGNVSMTLGNVAAQNNVTFDADELHDSGTDARLTLEVAKKGRQGAPEIWDQLLGLSTVEGVDAFLNANPVFTWASTVYGKSVTAVATSLTTRPNSDTQVLFDLSIDPEPYRGMDVEQLKNVFLSKNGKSPFILVRKGEQPVLMPLTLSKTVLPAGFDERATQMRAQEVKADTDFLARVAQAAALAKQMQAPAIGSLPELVTDLPADPAVQARLKKWIKEFHDAPDWKAAGVLANAFSAQFADALKQDPGLSRLAKFANRIVYQHAPQELGAEKVALMKTQIAARVLNPDLAVPYMTVAKARKELEAIEQDRASGKKWQDVTDSQIRSLKLYYTALEKDYAAHALKNNGTALPKPDSGPRP